MLYKDEINKDATQGMENFNKSFPIFSVPSILFSSTVFLQYFTKKNHPGKRDTMYHTKEMVFNKGCLMVYRQRKKKNIFYFFFLFLILRTYIFVIGE